MDITDADLLTLRTEAMNAGDLRQAMLCELAILGGYGVCDPGTEMDDIREQGITPEQAREMCAEAIADARAQDDS